MPVARKVCVRVAELIIACDVKGVASGCTAAAGRHWPDITTELQIASFAFTGGGRKKSILYSTRTCTA